MLGMSGLMDCLVPLQPQAPSPNLALSDPAGTDLLKVLTCQDLSQMCGSADGTPLFETVRARSWALPTEVSFPLQWPCHLGIS